MMQPTDILERGYWEPVKVGVHGTMLLGACVCAVYNLAAFLHRRETHNAVNAGIYAALVFLEISHVQHHLAEIQESY